MSGMVATQARWSINSTSQGNVRLRRVKDHSIKSERKKEAINAMGEDDPVGHTVKPGARTITFNVIEEQGNPEVDWEFLEESGEYFSLTKQLVNGKRVQYPECVVSSVEGTGDDEGKHMKSVEIIALRVKRL